MLSQGNGVREEEDDVGAAAGGDGEARLFVDGVDGDEPGDAEQEWG